MPAHTAVQPVTPSPPPPNRLHHILAGLSVAAKESWEGAGAEFNGSVYGEKYAEFDQVKRASSVVVRLTWRATSISVWRVTCDDCRVTCDA
jgi:hypothetical protein